MKKVGIIGSGNVGQALAQGFIDNGFEVTIASRSNEKRKELEVQFNGKLKTDTPENTAKFGDLIVFAVKGNQGADALKEMGIENLDGKTIIDTTNPISNAMPVNGVLMYDSSINRSLMEDLQEQAPKANFVKAFSSVGSVHMVNPAFESKPSMFICGNNPDAKKEVTGILEKFGWETEDMGTIEAARAIEPLAILWCIPGFVKNSWTHAFKLLKK
jgi:hypothetical protein